MGIVNEIQGLRVNRSKNKVSRSAQLVEILVTKYTIVPTVVTALT